MINITFINIIVYLYLIAVYVVMEWNNMHALPNTKYFKGKLVLWFLGEYGKSVPESGDDFSMINYLLRLCMTRKSGSFSSWNC